jgi:hypothetical protein
MSKISAAGGKAVHPVQLLQFNDLFKNPDGVKDIMQLIWKQCKAQNDTN